MRRIAVALCISTLCILAAAAAQQSQPSPPSAAPGTQGTVQGAQAKGAPLTPIRVTSQLIVEEVTVKDKSGKPVEGLTANDFTLTEDGVAQTISFAEFERIAPPNASAAPAPTSAPAVTTAPPATQIQIAPETPGDTRYRDHRLLALYFDMSTMQPADQLRAFDAALKFIDTQMDPSDLMAVIVFEGSAVRVRQDFTGDRAQV